MLEQFLLELALLFALCVAVAVTFHRLRLPPIVGFLVAGVLVGPNVIGLVHHEGLVRELAEVGIVVLLFAVGLEVPLHQLRRLQRVILRAGAVQIGATVLGAAAVCWALGVPPGPAVFLGFLLSLSSTAAASKMLVDHGELSAPHGRTVLGIAIAQDLAVVPMILVIPLLALAGGGGTRPLTEVGLDLGLLLSLAVVARLLSGPLMALVCRTRSRELFVLFLATWCLGIAALTAHLGMSLALGAFLAGILLADSDHHSQAQAEVEPFRDAFASLFFVSIGMLFDWRTVVEAPGTVLVIVLAVVLGKAAIVMAASWVLGQPFWVRVRAALTLAQVGEFSFVLVQLGRRADLLQVSAERLFVVAAVASIAVTPALYALGRWLARRASARAGGKTAVYGDGHERRDHAILVGFGPTGRTVAAALEAVGIPFVVAEMNAATVRSEKARGVPIVLADATRPAALKGLGVERAALVVLAVNDGNATRRIAQLVRQLAPQAHVIARAVYNHEVDLLQNAGAHEVVPQELEASVEILVRVLRHFVVPDDEVGRQVQKVRGEIAGRRAAAVPMAGADLTQLVPGLGFGVYRVAPGSRVVGRTLADAGVRRHTGCSVVAVRRGDRTLGAIVPETSLEVGDTVVVVGPQTRLADAAAMFAGAVAPTDEDR